MNRGELRTVVIAYAEQGAPSFIDITDEVAVNEVINRGLRDWSRWTYSIYEWDQPLTLGIGTMSYSTLPMFQVEVVAIDGEPLRNTAALIGAESRTRFVSRFPNWRNDANATPMIFVQDTQDHIWLYPAPDSTDEEVFLSGFIYHQIIDTASGFDNVEITVEENMADVLAMWIAQKLMWPAASGSATFQKMAAMDKIVADKLIEYRRANMGRLAGKKRIGHRPRRMTL